MWFSGLPTVKNSEIVKPCIAGRDTVHHDVSGPIQKTGLLYIKPVFGCSMNVASVKPASDTDNLQIRVISGSAIGGFPSPAADYYEPPVSVDELLNLRAPHVWIVQLKGDSMNGAGLFDGSRLVVDRAISAAANHIVLAYVDNQPIVKRLAKSADGWLLVSDNPAYLPITPGEYDTIEIFGVVTWCLTPYAA